MIPGPTEFSQDVLKSLEQPTESHVSPTFIETFGKTLELLRKVFLAEKTGQPFVLRFVSAVKNFHFCREFPGNFLLIWIFVGF